MSTVHVANSAADNPKTTYLCLLRTRLGRRRWLFWEFPSL